jgi:hypothetical protein
LEEEEKKEKWGSPTSIYVSNAGKSIAWATHLFPEQGS